VKRVPVAVLFVGVASCWGMNSVAMRVAGRYAPPLTVAALRAVIGAGVLIALARRSKAVWPKGRTEWMALALIGFFMTGVSTACLFLAAKNAPAGVVSIFSNTMPLFTAMLAPLILKERVSRQLLIGLIVGLIGTVIVAWRAIDGDIKALGVAFGIAAAAFTAFGSILYKMYPLVRLDRRMIVGMQLANSAVVLAVLSIPDDRTAVTVTWQLVLSFTYLALVGLALSFVMYSELLSRATAMQAGSAAYLATVVGVLCGAVLLGERLSWTVLAGGVVTIAGVAIVQVTQAGGSSGSVRRKPSCDGP
jgi:drug/metabolite transporter (DMT)-like permease